jgi:hypothetical protein
MVFLLIQLSVIALVFVLPQVDLLDTAFQNDSEPLAIHALAVASPLVLITAVAMGWILCLELNRPYVYSLEALRSPATSSLSTASPLRC